MRYNKGERKRERKVEEKRERRRKKRSRGGRKYFYINPLCF